MTSFLTVASTPKEEIKAPSLPSPPTMSITTEHECQLAMLRRALEGKASGTREAQERFVEEFVGLQARQEERMRTLVQAHKDLRQVSQPCGI